VVEETDVAKTIVKAFVDKWVEEEMPYIKAVCIVWLTDEGELEWDHTDIGLASLNFMLDKMKAVILKT